MSAIMSKTNPTADAIASAAARPHAILIRRMLVSQEFAWKDPRLEPDDSRRNQDSQAGQRLAFEK